MKDEGLSMRCTVLLLLSSTLFVFYIFKISYTMYLYVLKNILHARQLATLLFARVGLIGFIILPAQCCQPFP